MQENSLKVGRSVKYESVSKSSWTGHNLMNCWSTYNRTAFPQLHTGWVMLLLIWAAGQQPRPLWYMPDCEPHMFQWRTLGDQSYLVSHELSCQAASQPPEHSFTQEPIWDRIQRHVTFWLLYATSLYNHCHQFITL